MTEPRIVRTHEPARPARDLFIWASADGAWANFGMLSAALQAARETGVPPDATVSWSSGIAFHWSREAQ